MSDPVWRLLNAFGLTRERPQAGEGPAAPWPTLVAGVILLALGIAAVVYAGAHEYTAENVAKGRDTLSDSFHDVLLIGGYVMAIIGGLAALYGVIRAATQP
jgi:hypothetical protein